MTAIALSIGITAIDSYPEYWVWMNPLRSMKIRISGLEERLDKAIGNIIEIADTMRWRFEPQNWRKALSRLVDNPIAHAALAVRQNVARWVEKDARAADKVIKREVKSVRKELGALAAEAQQMRTSAKQLENERSSGRPESRSKGVDR